MCDFSGISRLPNMTYHTSTLNGSSVGWWFRTKWPHHLVAVPPSVSRTVRSPKGLDLQSRRKLVSFVVLFYLPNLVDSGCGVRSPATATGNIELVSCMYLVFSISSMKRWNTAIVGYRNEKLNLDIYGRRGLNTDNHIKGIPEDCFAVNGVTPSLLT